MTTEQTDAERLADIRARAEGATPGPWEHHDSNAGTMNHPGWEVYNDAYVNPPADGDAPWLAVELHTGIEADAEFIAHARTDVPWLLDRLADAEARAVRAEGQVAAMETVLTHWDWKAGRSLFAAVRAALASDAKENRRG